MPLTLQWNVAHVDPLGHILCVSTSHDGRSMTPDSHYRNTFFHFSELGSIFHSLCKPWSMPSNVPCVSLDLTPVSTQQHLRNKQGWDYDKETSKLIETIRSGLSENT